jgi:hypothetical protein
MFDNDFVLNIIRTWIDLGSIVNSTLSSSIVTDSLSDDVHDASSTRLIVDNDRIHYYDDKTSIERENKSIDHINNGHHANVDHRHVTRTHQDSMSFKPNSKFSAQSLINNVLVPSATASTVNKFLSNPSNSMPSSENRKGTQRLWAIFVLVDGYLFHCLVLTKSAKDLQRQTSTLSNVEMSFENEMKSSVKRIDDIFKQIRNIIKEREVELYLQIDQVKEQGLAIIHRRQQRATELRQRMDNCDRLEANEIDHLRTDIKQFVTDRRYDLGEELTSSHRFEYDQTVVDALKHFGSVLRIDRIHDRTRTMSTTSVHAETNGTVQNDVPTTVTSSEVPMKSSNDDRSTITTVSSSNDQRKQQALPQRNNHRYQSNGHNAGDYQHVNSYSSSSSQTNGYHHYYDDSNGYQGNILIVNQVRSQSWDRQRRNTNENGTWLSFKFFLAANRRRTSASVQQQQQQQQQQQGYAPYQNGNARRVRPTSSLNNNRRNGVQNSETNNTYRRPRPAQALASPVPPISN